MLLGRKVSRYVVIDSRVGGASVSRVSPTSPLHRLWFQKHTLGHHFVSAAASHWAATVRNAKFHLESLNDAFHQNPTVVATVLFCNFNKNHSRPASIELLVSYRLFSTVHTRRTPLGISVRAKSPSTSVGHLGFKINESSFRNSR